jgi:hypothetical protein
MKRAALLGVACIVLLPIIELTALYWVACRSRGERARPLDFILNGIILGR